MPQPPNFGEILGTTNGGVVAYSNGDDSYFSHEKHEEDGIFFGYKWQCVEFARRWLHHNKRVTLPIIRQAIEIWDLKELQPISNGIMAKLRSFPNGSSTPPQPGDMLIYLVSDETPHGHVAIVTETGQGFVRLAEQNWEFEKWSNHYARQLEVEKREDGYWIIDEDPVKGWVHPCFPPNPNLPMQRLSTHPRQSTDNWLDLSDPAEKLFADVVGTEVARNRDALVCYYSFSKSAEERLRNAVNELHLMCIAATERVINDDNLLSRFDVPNQLWPALRKSWEERDHNTSMAGRFDIGFDGHQLKMFEYNADTPGTLLEFSIVQDKWAAAVGCDIGTSGAASLHKMFVQRWKELNINGRLHMVCDDHEEERYTALYMQRAAKEAGLDCRLSVLMEDFHWKDGVIVDSEGIEVKVVWKLWMWETVFNKFLEQNKFKGQTGVSDSTPTLPDLLLSSNIRVIEPMWKTITGNKALLTVLVEMYPDSPHLLYTSWTLSDNLRRTGFVQKPIVGRCGNNINVYDKDGNLLAGTGGEFGDRESVYQELYHLPYFDGYHPVLGCWIVGDRFAGFGIREEKTLITEVDSPIVSCRVI